MYLNEAGRLVEISIHTKKYRIISSPTHYDGKKTYYSLNNNSTVNFNCAKTVKKSTKIALYNSYLGKQL